MSGFHLACDVFVTFGLVCTLVLQMVLSRRWRTLCDNWRTLALARRCAKCGAEEEKKQ